MANVRYGHVTMFILYLPLAVFSFSLKSSSFVLTSKARISLHYSHLCTLYLILTFDANTKLLDFTEKLKTASGKYRVNMVTWSFLQFALNAIINLSNLSIYCKRQTAGVTT